MKYKSVMKFCTFVAILGLCGWIAGCGEAAPAPAPPDPEVGSSTGGGVYLPDVDDSEPSDDSENGGEPESGDTGESEPAGDKGDAADESDSSDGESNAAAPEESESGDSALPEEDVTEEDEVKK